MTTYRLRVKRPKWEDITAEEPWFPFVTVKNMEGNDMKVLDNSSEDSRIDVLRALANIKYIAGENLPDMNSIFIYGINAQGTFNQIDLNLYPDYEYYSQLCLYCTINGSRYCFGLSNHYASCF